MTQKRRNRAAEANPVTTSPPSDTPEHTPGLGRSRRYWRRRFWLNCGCSDPCRCDYRDRPTPKRVDAYRNALDYLADHGLCGAALTPECRALWRRGGSDRALAEQTVRWWSA